MDVPEDMDVSGQPASGANNKLLLAGGGVAFVAVIAAIVFAVKFIKSAKKQNSKRMMKMRFPDLLMMSVNNLRRRKLRTFLTVLGVIIGTASIVVMVSLGIGFK